MGNEETEIVEVKEKGALFMATDDNAYIDLNSEFNWNGANLTDRQKAFIFFYAYSLTHGGKSNGADAARKAGYSKNTARAKATSLLKTKAIYSELKNIKLQIAQGLTKTDLQAEIARIINEKARRTKFDITELYDNDWNFKPKNELTDEQRGQILEVRKDGNGNVSIKTKDPVQAENELINIYKDFYNGAENNADEFATEETLAIIRERVVIAEKHIRENERLCELAGRFVDSPENTLEEP